MNNKGADQTGRMSRLVCAFCCSETPEDRLSWDESRILTAQVLLQLALAARNPVIRDFYQDKPKIVSRSRNTIITNCRQTHGTMRKGHTTTTRHKEDNQANQPALSSPSRLLQNANGNKATHNKT